jgi:hypothetical protein
MARAPIETQYGGVKSAGPNSKRPRRRHTTTATRAYKVAPTNQAPTASRANRHPTVDRGPGSPLSGGIY